MKNRAAQVVINLGYETLERLIGGDDEAAIQIRQTIVQQFANRHLKAVANSETVRQVGAAIEAAVVEAVQAQVGKKAPGYGGKLTFNPEIKAAIHEEVRNPIATKVREEVLAAVEGALEKIRPEIADRVNKAVDREIAAQVRAAVAQKLQAAQEALK
jgi:hypothetical protein